MDSLQIKSLSVATQIGVHAWEQRIKQRLLIDITIPSDFNRCKDTLADTLDYDALCQLVTAYVEAKNFCLIETVANEVAAVIKEKFYLEQVTISVSKPHAIKNASDIRVTVVR